MMMRMSEAAAYLHADWIGGKDVEFSRVVIDSRLVMPGDLFVALKGDTFDGHHFIESALSKGAVGIIIDQTHPQPEKGPFIVVEETTLALGKLGAKWREKMNVKVCAVTGSSGKTSVKEMTATILRHAYGAEAVLATAGNFNNHIGLPLTLLALKPTHRFLVIEMGMNHFGEIRYLTQLARPEVALINNAQGAHLEFLGSVEGVARAKAEIFEGLSDKGFAIINADDTFAEQWKKDTANHTQLTFALMNADVCADNIMLEALSSHWTLTIHEQRLPVVLPVPGLHNIYNALAAAAMAFTCGVALNEIVQGLSQFRAFPGRLQEKTASQGAVLIDDTYNANPSSMQAAIDVLAACSGPRLLILGEMGEVGVEAEKMHRALGSYAANKQIDSILALGKNMQFAVDAFNEKHEGRAEHFSTIEALIQRAQECMTDYQTILAKGSRAMRMERVVKALESNQQQSFLRE